MGKASHKYPEQFLNKMVIAEPSLDQLFVSMSLCYNSILEWIFAMWNLMSDYYPSFTCSKSAIETAEQNVKFVQG